MEGLPVGLEHGAQDIPLNVLRVLALHRLKRVIAVPVVSHIDQHTDNPRRRGDMEAGVLGKNVRQKRGTATR